MNTQPEVNNYENLFDYIIIPSKNRKKTIQIRVINGLVNVHTPLKCSKELVLDILKKRLSYIVPRIKAQDNKKIKFLGKVYNIQIIETKLLLIPKTEIIDNIFFVYKPFNKTINLTSVINDFKKKECKKYITQKIVYFLDNYTFNFDIATNKIAYKNQKTKWGSCSSLHNLNFNYNIIEKRPEIIDYVIVHELSHTIFMNHSQNFWNYVKNIIPNCKELRQELNQF